MRQFQFYCLRYDVQITPTSLPAPAPTLVSGYIYIAFRNQTEYLDGNNLYRKLGIFKVIDIQALDAKPTITIIRHLSDVARIGLVGQISFTLVEGEPGTGIPAGSARIKGIVPYFLGVSSLKAAEEINNHRFLLASRPGVIFHTIPGETKITRRKSTAPTFTIVNNVPGVTNKEGETPKSRNVKGDSTEREK